MLRGGQTFYALTATEFMAVLLQRVKNYEQQLADAVMQETEFRAVMSTVEETPEVKEHFDQEIGRLSGMIHELRIRIDALRSLANGEFDQPKEE